LFQSAPTSNIGIATFANEQDILVFPNPATNQVFIDLGDIKPNALEQTEIGIYSIIGELVYRQERVQASLVSIAIDALPKGTYLVDITDGEKSIRKKLIVQ